jgi:predicted amidohydrolase
MRNGRVLASPRTLILCAILALLLCAIPFKARIVDLLPWVVTVSDRLEEYGEAARARLSPHFESIGVEYPPEKIILVGLKKEKMLEVWVSPDGQSHKLLKSYPVLGASGTLGPKLREGDMQVPEGIYRVESLHPASLYHLALRLDYPNDFDGEKGRLDGRTDLGSDIMIHGKSCSIGCLAMGDTAIEELFVLAAETGIENITVILSPVDFRSASMPETGRPLPAWTGELYAEIESKLSGLLKPADGRVWMNVKVAAIQCYSRMGEVRRNRALLTQLVHNAAEKGAKIIVTPECAVCGYMDPATEMKWSSRPEAGDPEMDVNRVAETIPGPSTKHFAALAGKLGAYLCIGLIEKSDGKFYNSQVLLDPHGEIAAHHRKRAPWAPGDGLWMTKGDRPIQVVDSPYGRLGLMICRDYHVLPELLAKKRADIVLYSVGWYAPNPKGWFSILFPRKVVVPNRFSVVAANWSAEKGSPGWPGHGYSCIISSRGELLGMAAGTRGSEIVIADLPFRSRPTSRPSSSTSSGERMRHP